MTRDGRNVTIHCTNYIGEQHIIAQVEGHDLSFSFYEDGRYAIDRTENPIDIFFVPEKHEGWLNIYRSDECGFYMRGESPYKSKEEADAVAKANPKTFFTTIKVEWEE